MAELRTWAAEAMLGLIDTTPVSDLILTLITTNPPTERHPMSSTGYTVAASNHNDERATVRDVDVRPDSIPSSLVTLEQAVGKLDSLISDLLGKSVPLRRPVDTPDRVAVQTEPGMTSSVAGEIAVITYRVHDLCRVVSNLTYELDV